MVESWFPHICTANMSMGHPNPGAKTRRFEAIQNQNMNQTFRRDMSHTLFKKGSEWLEWTSSLTGKQIGIASMVDHLWWGRAKAKNILWIVFYPRKKSYTSFMVVIGMVAATRRTKIQEFGSKNRNKTNHRETTAVGLYCCWEMGMWMRSGKEQVETDQRLHEHAHEFENRSDEVQGWPACQENQHRQTLGWLSCVGALVECDVEIPRWYTQLINHFAESPPICKNFGPQYACSCGKFSLMKKPRRNLINSNWTKQVFFSTTLLKLFYRKRDDFNKSVSSDRNETERVLFKIRLLTIGEKLMQIHTIGQPVKAGKHWKTAYTVKRWPTSNCTRTVKLSLRKTWISK